MAMVNGLWNAVVGMTPAAPSLALRGEAMVAGAATGRLMCADVGLSFWGGVDPATGAVIDARHPLHGESITGRVLAIPSGRGSCTGSQVVLELILSGRAPAAILLRQPDDIISLGAVVAEELFDASLPVVCLGEAHFSRLLDAADGLVQVEADGTVQLEPSAGVGRNRTSAPSAAPSSVAAASAAALPGGGPTATPASFPTVRLTDTDVQMLDGAHGEAARVAMRVIARMAELQRASGLVDVGNAHIDGCIYIGPGGLRLAETLVGMGGRVAVPTSLNAISVDMRRWRELGVGSELGEPAQRLADAYVALGAEPTFTCAPYLRTSAPSVGEHVAWGESNAVVFANSVLGARTQKVADFLDVCIALTGRAPAAGVHTSEARRAGIELRLELSQAQLRTLDDAFFATLGYVCGLEAAGVVPLVTGLESAQPSRDDLKAFSAAFGTTSAVPLFHMAGHTPEAAAELERNAEGAEADGIEVRTLDLSDVARAYHNLDSGDPNLDAGDPDSGGLGSDGAASAGERDDGIQLVSLGNPHFSLSECERLAELTRGREKADGVSVVVTVGREVLGEARAAGHADEIERFGATILSDTCHCMLTEPVVPPAASSLVTNSAKYAHYAPGLTGRRVRFANLEGCVAAATTGRVASPTSRWLRPGLLGAAASAARGAAAVVGARRGGLGGAWRGLAGYLSGRP